jgi:ribosomal protein S18 acetylase RimI-like enzyme
MTGASAGLLNITTLPDYRRCGFGAAITRSAVRDGFAAGASLCWLESSVQGYPVYGEIGFETIGSWTVWL